MANVGTNTSNARTTDWRTLVVQADPDWVRSSRFVIEHEFSTPGRGHGANSERTIEEGMRVFRADYQSRGAYIPDADPVTDGLVWNGQQLVWNGQRLTWKSKP